MWLKIPANYIDNILFTVKALEDLPQNDNTDPDDRSPDVELPIYQQRDNFFTWNTSEILNITI